MQNVSPHWWRKLLHWNEQRTLSLQVYRESLQLWPDGSQSWRTRPRVRGVQAGTRRVIKHMQDCWARKILEKLNETWDHLESVVIISINNESELTGYYRWLMPSNQSGYFCSRLWWDAQASWYIRESAWPCAYDSAEQIEYLRQPGTSWNQSWHARLGWFQFTTCCL